MPSPPAVEPLRIGYVLDRFPSLHQTFVLAEMRALERLGHSITVFSLTRPAAVVPADAARLHGHVVYAPPWPSLRRYGAAKATALRHPAAFYATARLIFGDRPRPATSSWLRGVAFAHAARSLDLNHIHAHFGTGANVAAMTMSRLIGVPFSFTTHAVDLYARPLRLCQTIAASKFHVTVSEYNRAFLRSHCADTPGIEVIFDAINPEDFPPDTAARAGDGAGTGPFRIVSVGRLVPKKGHLTLVDAVGRLRGGGLDVHLTIVGDGPGRDELRARVTHLELADTVHLAGALQSAEIRSLLGEADAFALACTIGPDGDRDGIPVSIMEAMAAGLPVVSTTVSGIAELVTPEAGILVTPDDPSAIAVALETLASDRELRKSLGATARKQVLRLCDVNKNAARLAALMSAR